MVILDAKTRSLTRPNIISAKPIGLTKGSDPLELDSTPPGGVSQITALLLFLWPRFPLLDKVVKLQDSYTIPLVSPPWTRVHSWSALAASRRPKSGALH